MSRRLVFAMILVMSFVFLSVFVGAVQSQASDLPPLTEPGPYGVRLKALQFVDPSREGWTLDAFVWYPADKTNATLFRTGSLVLKDAPPDRSGAPYPLIIYSHARAAGNADLSNAMEQLASYGYVVAAPKHHDMQQVGFEFVDRPLDIVLVLDGLAAITDGDLAGMIDTNDVGLMGWSQGGTASLQMLGLLRDPVNYVRWCAEHPDLASWDCVFPTAFGGWDFEAIAAYRKQIGLETLPDGRWPPFGDPRIKAALVLAPCYFPLTTEDMLAATTTPIMILHGTEDGVCGYEGNAVRTFTHWGSNDRYLITLVEADHHHYDLYPIPQHFATAFFGSYLKGDQTYAPYLTAENLPVGSFPELVWGPYES